MTSKLKVNIIADGGDNAIMTSNGSGTLTLNNAALKATPAFYATQESAQSISSGSVTVISFDTESLDTNSCYSTSTYRFTPNVSGFYYVFMHSAFDSNTDFDDVEMQMYKNNSTQIAAGITRNENKNNISISAIVQLNGSSDYVDARAYQNSGGAIELRRTGGQTVFGGYRIIGA